MFVSISALNHQIFHNRIFQFSSASQRLFFLWMIVLHSDRCFLAARDFLNVLGVILEMLARLTYIACKIEISLLLSFFRVSSLAILLSKCYYSVVTAFKFDQSMLIHECIFYDTFHWSYGNNLFVPLDSYPDSIICHYITIT